MSFKISPYNSDWPKQFDDVCDAIRARLHDIKDIAFEHIGATAVPTLPAQPIIDILITVPCASLDKALDALRSAPTYTHHTPPDTTLGAVFKPTATPNQTPHTIYLCAQNTLPARAHLAIRNTLRTDPALLASYTDLKTHFTSPPHDVNAYTTLKSPHLQHLLIASATFSNTELQTLLHSPTPHRWPPLHTPRLTLREFRLADAPALFRLEGSEENARYQDWPPWTLCQAREAVVRGIQGSYGAERAVVEVAVVYEGEVVGRVGGRVELLSSPVDSRAAGDEGVRKRKRVDLWFSFLPRVQGKGLATEAVRAFVGAVGEREGEGTVLELRVECDPRNTGSWRLAERLGFEKYSLTERAWESKGEWVDSLVYRRVV